MTNNLELYLNDVCKRECVLKAEQEEVEFIKKGIETLVQEIADRVLDLLSQLENFEFKEFFTTEKSNDEKIQKFQQSLVEVYFPIRTETNFIKVETTKCPIIKVGSFYEEAKNNFPDEFDFIFLLFCIRKSADSLSEGTFEYPNRSTLMATCINLITGISKEFLIHGSPDGAIHETRKLYFDEYLTDHGPASMLQFIYNDGAGCERYIHVDLVPGFKVIVKKDILPRDVKIRKKKRRPMKSMQRGVMKFINTKAFCKEAYKAGTCLNVSGKISFTETEVHFMRNILSKKHVKIYRILKVLINGHGDDEALHSFVKSSVDVHPNAIVSVLSSYQIKTMMIYHHDVCINTDTEEIGPCVLQVLEAMYENVGKDKIFPWLFIIGFDYFRFNHQKLFDALPYLKRLIQMLRVMQIAEDNYEYENVESKSVSRQHMDTLYNEYPDEWLKFQDKSGANQSREIYRTELKLNKCLSEIFSQDNNYDLPPDLLVSTMSKNTIMTYVCNVKFI